MPEPLQVTQILSHLPDQFNCVAFAPDGRMLASAAADSTVKLWDVTTRQLLHTFEGHQGSVTSVAFAPDGRTLASAASDSTVKLWDVTARQLLHTFEGRHGIVYSVVFAPDGRTLASAASDSTVKLWDVTARQLLHTFEGHQHRVTSVVFAPDGRTLASAADDSTVKLWDVTARQLLHTFEGHQDRVTSVAFALDGRTLASAASDSTVKLWDVTARQLLHTFESHQDRVTSVAFAPDGRTLASAASDSTVKLWDVTARQLLHTFEGHQDRVTSVVFAPDGRTLASAAWDSTVKLWDVRTQNLRAGFWGKTAKIFGVTARQLLHTFEGHQDRVTSVAFAPDGRTLASAASDSTVKLWDVTARQLLHTFEGHQGSVTSVAFALDGRTLASAASDSTVKLWDVTARQLLHTFEGRHGIVYSVVFAPDGRTLASAANDNTVKLWDVTARQLRHTFEGRHGIVYSVAFAPDGRTLASAADDSTVKLWDVTARQLLHTFKGHQGRVYSVVFAPDGKTLASAAADGTVKLWDVTARQLLHTFEGHQHIVTSVAFAPDGKTLSSTSFEGTVIIWDIETRAILQAERWQHPAWRPLAVTYQTHKGTELTFGKTPYGHDDIIVRTVSINPDAPAKPFTRYVSAKIVLIGESEVGKSCLASRLATNEYVELGSTHGMKLWQMKPEQLDPNAAAPDGEQRDITIWDLGGQDEYRLVHQLFLHDTTLALMLFSPDRGAKALDDVREWNLRLEKQKRGATTKLLIGTKADAINAETIDHNGINALLAECCMTPDWHLVSAKVGTNIDALKAAISQAIDWKSLSTTTRPLLFQLVREAITERQQRGEVVLLYSELEQQIQTELHDGESFDSGAVRTVVDQLERQGVIVDTFLSSGERALVLQIGYIEIYASSLILIAKSNSRGVPALELAELDGMKSYPGIKPEERLHLFQERIVIECVVQLLLQHGLCLKHEGLLIFPALFPTSETKESDGTETVSLYYDFTGAIDNIYSSLVVKLAHSERFGRVRLSGNRADYDQCGLRKVDRRSGWAHLDLVFNDKIAKATRDLFTVFVEEHLEKEGVTIKEVLAMKCGNCGETIEEDKVRSRIELGHTDIACWKCDTRLPIHEGAKKARAGSDKLRDDLIALRTKIEAKKDRDINDARRALDSVELFFSYSHKDDELRHELVKHLSTLRRRGVISNWHDRLIGAGDEWRKEIDSHLESARIVLLLISPDFIASDYCWDKEMKRAIERHKAGEARVIPIALRPTTWNGAPFSELQALPTDRKAVTMWTNRDEAFVNIAEGIETEVERLLRPPTATNADAADIAAPIIALQTPTRILHLSDLHFGVENDVDVRLYQLSRDLKDKTDGLGFDTLDYLVISGDLTNRASKEEFDHAYEFISGVIERFKLSAERCIIVPGNHDLSWEQKVYGWEELRADELSKYKPGSYKQQGEGYLIRDEAKYPLRFDNFNRFYHSLIQLPYPLQPEAQCQSFLYDEPRLQFLTLNSAWEIDRWFQDRASIHDKALAKGLSEAERQIEQAKAAGRLHKDANVLRLAVWHHPVTGNEKIVNDAFLEQLRKADVKLCLHGHVHEDRADLVGYLHPTRKLHIAGAGSFGAGAKERPAAIPRLYNLLEIWRDHSKIRVHTRCLKKDGGAWEGWAVWPGADNHTKRSFYEIELR